MVYTTGNLFFTINKSFYRKITSKETFELLNDLVQINNDRIKGYEKALEEAKDADADLKTLFKSMIDESRKIRMDLASEVQALGGDIESGTTDRGKLYRVWMDVKAIFSGSDRHAVLANCQRGEDAAQHAYNKSLEEEHVPAYIRTTLFAQQQILKVSHDRIKNLRDAAK